VSSGWSQARRLFVFSWINNLQEIAGLSEPWRVYALDVRESRLEIIGSAASGIAHDINNQLTLIVNHLSVADVESARAAVDRCSALTASLLFYCRGEAIALDVVDPAIFLRHFAAQLCLPGGIDLVLGIPAALPAIAANRLALTRVLTNLVSNACAAMEGKGTLWISATPGTIEVRDSGPGIPDEYRKQIFDPFFTTKGADGIGLGLSLVRDLMRQQGGSVTMLSETGCGAQFTLLFRLHLVR
jgi:two-component system NtrC family sensor kinase